MSGKVIVVVRYDLDEPGWSDEFAARINDLHERLKGFAPANVWIAHGDACERVSAAVDAEADR
jgi:hypothetical protein